MTEATNIDPASPGPSTECRCAELALEVAELRGRLEDIAPFLFGEPDGELDGLAELYKRVRVLEQTFLAVSAILRADSAQGAAAAEADIVTRILTRMHDPLRRQRDVDDEYAIRDSLDGGL